MAAARREALAAGYHSGLEHEFGKILKSRNIDSEYESVSLKYEVPAQTRTYTPDFPVGDNVVFETKGRFVRDDRKKMLLVKAQYPNKRFVLVFSQPYSKINKGAKTTYADWCDKNGFEWLDFKTVKDNPQCLLNTIKSSEGGRLKESPTKKKKC